MQGLCAEKNTIGLRKRLITAVYSRSPTKNPRIVISEVAGYSSSVNQFRTTLMNEIPTVTASGETRATAGLLLAIRTITPP